MVFALNCKTPRDAIAALCIVLGVGAPVSARPAEEPLRELRRLGAPPDCPGAAKVPPSSHTMRLDLAVMSGSGWEADSVLEAARGAAHILEQCGIRTHPVELRVFDGPSRYRLLFTAVSREFAQRAGRRAIAPGGASVVWTAHRDVFVDAGCKSAFLCAGNR